MPTRFPHETYGSTIRFAGARFSGHGATALLIAVGLAACGGVSGSDGELGQPCTVEGRCVGGLVCEQDVCVGTDASVPTLADAGLAFLNDARPDATENGGGVDGRSSGDGGVGGDGSGEGSGSTDADIFGGRDAGDGVLMVPCDRENGSPPNATDIVVDVAITYNPNTGTWSAPAKCDWLCDSNYDDPHGAGVCINEETVECVPSASKPANAHSLTGTGTARYSEAHGWVLPECGWECNARYGDPNPGDGIAECVDHQIVYCADIVALPAHASFESTQVSIGYTTGVGWDSPDCPWACDPIYGDPNPDDGVPECANHKTVNCADVVALPANAHFLSTQVSVGYTTGVGWNAPACPWECNANYGDPNPADNTYECVHEATVTCVEYPTRRSNDHYLGVHEVTRTYTTADGWSSDECPWACDQGYQENAQETACVNWPVYLMRVPGKSGSLDGRDGADAHCATEVPILWPDNPFTKIKAFISVAADDEIRDMPDNYGVPTGAQIVAYNGGTFGKVIAQNWAALLDGPLDQVPPDDFYWYSGSYEDGSLHPNNCDGWTAVTHDASDDPQGHIGYTGNLGGTWGFLDGTWISQGDDLCGSSVYYLLCLLYAPDLP